MDPRGIVIVAKGKVVMGIEPAVAGSAKAGEGTQFDHGLSPWVRV
jgi:hypothetical protein